LQTEVEQKMKKVYVQVLWSEKKLWYTKRIRNIPRSFSKFFLYDC